MKAGGSRRKGKSFERKVAKMIIQAFGLEKTDCYSTPLSGGHFAASKLNPSDLEMSPKLRKLLPYAIECKSYKDLELEKLFSSSGKRGHWAVWWKQVNKAAGDYEPLLVFKQNRSEVMALVASEVTRQWRPVLFTTLGGIPVTVCLFKDFLADHVPANRKVRA